ncbi:glycosyltransferase [Roseovarius faecimaris]|uniref:Glycosyltransferase n=1 Tax=Roseovarius faecimaris TaxID=2494550 RepID=A0A6I6IVQ8_9RHOB|nr:glycosyltransferase [Roseovarius faecimaris]QGX99506.1 glycosyltransferase [Roseovarius faecimaris]
MSGAPFLSVILPAHNEAAYIGACLEAVLASADVRAELIVVANACTDETAEVARRLESRAQAAGWAMTVIDTATPGKLNALNQGDAAARGTIRAYLDADVIVSPRLLSEIVAALDTDQPRYASGSPVVSAARSGVTRAYARIWQRLPFVTRGVPGFGLFAVNAAGRARWQDFPDIIADDHFVRLQFAPEERVRVSAPYSWPMVEGLRNLVRVRRRQDAGVAEIAARYPALLRNEDVARPGLGVLLPLALRDPVGFAVYLAVKLAVKLPVFENSQRWERGR